MIRLKEIRKQRHYTQKQIAEIINTTQAQVSRIEKGENVINSKQIIKLCETLQVSSDYLLGLEGDKI